MPPLELESNVSLWLSAVSQYKARVTFCSYSVMEMCTKGLGAQTGVLRVSAPAACWPASLLGSARSQVHSKLGHWSLKKRLSALLPAAFQALGHASSVSLLPCGQGRGARLKRAGALWDPRAPIGSARVLEASADLGPEQSELGSVDVEQHVGALALPHRDGSGGGGAWAQGGPRCPCR